MMNRLGNLLASPQRALNRISAIFSPGIEPDKKKRRRSGEQTPNSNIRKIIKLAPSLKRPKRPETCDENDNPANKKRKTDAIFVEKEVPKKEELIQRKDERARWCRQTLHKQFEDDIPTGDEPELMTVTPIRPNNKKQPESVLRRSARASSARASRRISMQFGDVHTKVLQRKQNQAILVEKAIQKREAERADKELDDERCREERQHWQSIYAPKLKARVASMDPLRVLKTFCPEIAVTGSNIQTAFRKAMSRFHPDRSKSLPSIEKQVEAEEIFKILVEVRDSIV